MIEIRIQNRRVAEVCRELGIDVPFITIFEDAPIQNGKAVFGRAYDASVVKMYRGSFEVSYRGALKVAPQIATPESLLNEYAKKASHVLLHELYHCKQFADGTHLALHTEEIEKDAAQFAVANEGRWDDLVLLKESTAPKQRSTE